MTVLGSRRLLENASIALPESIREQTERAEAGGHTVVHLAIDEWYAGAFELRPEVRPEAAGVVAALIDRGLDVMILTGDEEGPTRRLAESLGIDRWMARTLPEEKDARIAELVDTPSVGLASLGQGLTSWL